MASRPSRPAGPRVLSAVAIASRQGFRRQRPFRDSQNDYNRLSPPGPGRGTDKIKTMGLIFCNPDSGLNMALGNSWNISEVTTSPTVKGNNWQMYRDKLFSMGYPTAAWIDTTLAGQPAFQVGGAPYGDAAAALCSFFDITMIGHWPSDNFMARVIALAAAQGRVCEVGNCYFNYETINQGADFVPVEETLREIIKADYLLEGTGPNGYGCTKVDQFELTAGNHACPPTDAVAPTIHTWYADCTDLSGAEADAMLTAYSAIRTTHYPSNKPTHLMTDNYLPRPNWGTASNEPVIADATYVAYNRLWQTRLATVTGLNRWGNTGDVNLTDYSATILPHRYGEFFLHLAGDSANSTSKTLATIQTELDTCKANGIRMALSAARKNGEVDLWMTSTGPGGTKGTWADLRNYMLSRGLRDNMVALALRTSTGFYAHWQPEFGVL